MTSLQVTPNKTDKLLGIVERITFHSQESGFCVLRIQVKGHRNLATVIGKAVSIHAGESIAAQGYWVCDSTHGMQFKATHLEIVAPTTLLGIEKYLGSGMIKGIGPHFAKKLVVAFGTQTFDVIENQPEKLLDLPGIGQKRQQQVLAAWQEQSAVRDIMVFLQRYQMSSARAVRIYKTYGNEAIAKIQENPYRLAQEVYGIGFKTADSLAFQMGIPQDSLLRAKAGVLHVMHNLSSEGHCAASLSHVTHNTVDLLHLSESLVAAAIEETMREGDLVKSDLVAGECLLALNTLYQAEISVAKQLQRLLRAKTLPWVSVDTIQSLSQLEQHTGFTLSASQQLAITQALQSKVFILTGGPGVGKTTVVQSLLTILQSSHQLHIALCAPTGRAAKRLTETTGREAKTIHRLLEFDPQRFQFKYHLGNPLPIELLVVDEASMLDIMLMNHLLKALPTHAALLLIGDSDQLPSVGPGRVLADLIESHCIPEARLTEIFRQAATSQIIVNAHRINQGQLPLSLHAHELSDFYFIEAHTPEAIQAKIIELVTTRIPNRFKLHPIYDIQVLTPMNRGGTGTQVLNNMLQERLNKQEGPRIERFGTTFAVGDKLIQRINNYDKLIFNGDIGYITSINLEETSLQVNFEGRLVSYHFSELDELALAYAMSIHKSQGSEYPAVVIPLAMQHYRMLARNLVYTGVTRGKQLVIVVGEKKALGIAVKKNESSQRLTQLQRHITACLKVG